MGREQPEPRDEAPRGELDDAALVEALASAVPETPSAETRSRHLATISTLADEHAHESPARQRDPAPVTWRARLRRVAGLTALKIGLSGAAVALAAGGGLAATGNLPDPAQRVVADVAERAGIRIPSPPPRSAQPAAGDDTSARDERTPSEQDRGPEPDRRDHDVAPEGEQTPDEDSREPQEVPGETVRPDDPPARGDDPDRGQRPDDAGNEAENEREQERGRGAGNSGERPERTSPAGDREDQPSERPGLHERQQGSDAGDDHAGADDAERNPEASSDGRSAADGKAPAVDVTPTPGSVSRQSRPDAVEDSLPPGTGPVEGEDAGVEPRDEQRSISRTP